MEELNLSGKELKVLPSEIGRLTSLRALDLSHNQLSSLPAEIGQLINLKSFYLRNNQLSSLPLEVGQLTSLQSLDLRYNPSLKDPPPEVVEKGIIPILAYCRQQSEQGQDYLYEAKLLIVGEGETVPISCIGSIL